MEIAPLDEHPEHIPTLARWHLAEWGHHSTGRTQESTEERLRRHAASDAIPLTMVALEAGEPVGSAALVWNDMKTRPKIRPWLADVVVDPAWRRRGIGSKLVRRLVEKARELGVETLYLYTPDQDRLYTSLGWETVERLEYRDEEVVLMKIAPGTQQALKARAARRRA
jgi:N-acetylglutamate synthase-like GNAT family acetyltransferase